VDPARRSLGRFFAEEIATPLGIEFYIGLPDGFDRDRRATIVGRNKYAGLAHLNEIPRGLWLALINPRSLFTRTFSNPRELLVDTNYNRPDVLAVEMPAANGIGEPRAVAAAYSAAVTGRLGLSSQTLDALTRPAQPPSGGLFDLVLRVEPTLFSLGYLKPAAEYPFGSSAGAAFGTPGNGGSFGFADPDTLVGYCYAPNRPRLGSPDGRPRDRHTRGPLPRRSRGEIAIPGERHARSTAQEAAIGGSRRDGPPVARDGVGAPPWRRSSPRRGHLGRCPHATARQAVG
jgi:hypothetical protein